MSVSSSARWRRGAATAVRAAVTAGIFWYLFSQIDFRQWGATTRNAFNFWLLAAIAANCAMVGFSTVKWDRLLSGLDVFMKLKDLIKLYLIGFFASACLPGIVGGDALRWHLATKMIGGRGIKIGATILAERALGVMALVAICVAVIARNWQQLGNVPLLVLCGAMTSLLFCGIAFAVNRRLNTSIRYFTRHSFLAGPANFTYRLHRAFRLLPATAVMSGLAYSVGFYVAGAFATYFVARAFGVEIAFEQVLAIQALACLLLLIPISLGGLGLGQAADVYLFGQFGIGVDVALGISLVGVAIKYLFVLLGGLLFIQWQVPARQAAHAPGERTSASR